MSQNKVVVPGIAVTGATGELATVSDTVLRLTGHEAQSSPTTCANIQRATGTFSLLDNGHALLSVINT